MATLQINNEIMNFGKIIYVSPTGSDTGLGTKESPFATTEKAVTFAASGDAIVFEEGVYTQLIKLSNNYGHAGIHDQGKSIFFYGGGKAKIIVLGNNSPLRDIHAISLTHASSIASGFAIDYDPQGKAGGQYTCSLFGSGDANYGKIKNCHIIVRNTFSFVYSNGGSILSIENTQFSITGKTIQGNYSGTINSLTNCSFDVPSSSVLSCLNSSTLNTCLYGVLYDEDYFIKDPTVWRNIGTGLDIDGMRASIGVYGGLLAWENNVFILRLSGKHYTYSSDGIEELKGFVETEENLKINSFKSVNIIKKEDLKEIMEKQYEILIISKNTKPPTLQVIGNKNYINLLESSEPEIICNYESPQEDASATYSYIPNSGYYKYRVHVDDPLTADNPDRVLSDWSEIKSANTDSSVTIPAGMLTHLNPYPVTVEVEQIDNKTIKDSGQVLIFNETPTVFGKINGKELNIIIGDPDRDKVRYQVKMNGKRILPIGTNEFTEFRQSPIELIHNFKTSDYKIGTTNLVEIIAEDELGVKGSVELSFIGDYYGMLFCKEDGTPFSTDEGVVLERLDFGLVFAGRQSDAKKAYIKNNNSYPVTNLSVSVDKATVPDATNVYISKEEEPFVHGDTLSFEGTLLPGEQKEFYIKIAASPFARTGSAFKIRASADPATA